MKAHTGPWERAGAAMLLPLTDQVAGLPHHSIWVLLRMDSVLLFGCLGFRPSRRTCRQTRDALVPKNQTVLDV